MSPVSNPENQPQRITTTQPKPRQGGDTIAQLLVQQGMITADQLHYAKRVQAKLISNRALIDVLKALRQLTNTQLNEALKKQRLNIRIGDLLVELGQLRQEDLDAALAIQKESSGNRKLGDVLVEYDFIDEHHLIEILATKLSYPFVLPDFAEIDRQLLQKVPMKVFNQHCFVPISNAVKRTKFAFADPLDLEDREAADRIFGRMIAPAIAPRQTIREAIELYRRGAQRGETSEADDSTVIGIVNALFDDAMLQGISDIHIEPMKDRLRVRFRRDGVLGIHKEYNLDLAPAITTRLKVMAEADIAERRRHQDGRILYESAATGVALDLRVSFYITVHGEKVVLRLMNKKGELLAIEDIGMAPRMLQQFRDDALE